MKQKLVTVITIMAIASVLSGQVIDLEMTEIIRPEDVEPPDVGFLCRCSINNNHSDTVFARVDFEIRHPASYPCYFTDTLHDYPLAPGEIIVESTKEFVPELGMEVQAYYMVTHPDDVDEENNSLTKDFEIATGIDEEPLAEFNAEFIFGEELKVILTLDKPTRTLLSLWDVTGKLISLRSETYPEGCHMVNLDISDLSPGVYFLRFVASGFGKTVKVVRID